MRKIASALIVFLTLGTLAAQTVTLTFTAKDAANHYVQLNRVIITNLTKSWQETIYWPDTVLTMQNGTGIDDHTLDDGFVLSQNNPNPFSGTTEVSLTTVDEGKVDLDIKDMNGRIIETQNLVSLQPGNHQFRISLSTAGTYVMTARQNGKTSSIKMICNGGGGSNTLDYLGMVQTITVVLKSSTNKPFNFGDMMEYVGYATINGAQAESQRITQTQGSSQTFTLQFSETQIYYMPTVTTNTVSGITSNAATCGGNVTSDGGAAVTERGVCWSLSHNPTISGDHTTNGSGTGAFTSSLTGLYAGRTYYVRAYARNSVGTSYGNEVSFTTSATLPEVTTGTVSNVTGTSAYCGNNYVTSVVAAPVTARGVCWSTSQNPTLNDSHTSNGSGTGSFGSSITGLAANTVYYVRAYATNSVGTAYGNVVSFTTLSMDGQPCPNAATLTDIDGNTYNTVQIGNQCWMKENLRTTRYANGAGITLTLEGLVSYTTAYRYYPDNNSSNVSTYGYLYNWKAVMGNSSSSNSNPSGVQGICPIGWHVPSGAEWTQLTDYVSSQGPYICNANHLTTIAKALASTDTNWCSSSANCAVGNNPSANNATGFSALPAGYYDGTTSLGSCALFSSTTESGSTSVFVYALYCYASNVGGVNVGGNASEQKNTGVSVRCLRDDGRPTVNTDTVSSITNASAICGGDVTATGGSSVTVRGVCWSTSQNPTVSNNHTSNGTGTGTFTSNITGLVANTTYYVRAYATNSAGTAYGERRAFTTMPPTPIVTTNTISNITDTTATCGGNVTATGESSVTARGVCWSTSQNPTVSDSHTTDGTGTGSFTSSITGLTAGTTYFVRAYATNSAGTAYGDPIIFTTSGGSISQDGQPCPGTATVTDIDGNIYNSVQIGNQCWMKESLRTTRYANGAGITLTLEGLVSYTTAYRYYPANNSSNVSTYGYLYNWKAVMGNSSSSNSNPSGVQGICPTGWHVPSGAEWTQLTDYVSSQGPYICNANHLTTIAKALASTDTNWCSSSANCAVGNNPSANNATGFSALPAGYYYWTTPLGSCALFSSTTEPGSTSVFVYALYCYASNVGGVNVGGNASVQKNFGVSVRCLKD